MSFRLYITLLVNEGSLIFVDDTDNKDHAPLHYIDSRLFLIPKVLTNQTPNRQKCPRCDMNRKAMTATDYKSTDIPCYNSIDPCLLFSRGNSIVFCQYHVAHRNWYTYNCLQLKISLDVPCVFFRSGLFLSLHKCMVRV